MFLIKVKLLLKVDVYLYANEAWASVAGEVLFDVLVCSFAIKVHVFFQLQGCHSNPSLVSLSVKVEEKEKGLFQEEIDSFVFVSYQRKEQKCQRFLAKTHNLNIFFFSVGLLLTSNFNQSFFWQPFSNEFVHQQAFLTMSLLPGTFTP